MKEYQNSNSIVNEKKDPIGVDTTINNNWQINTHSLIGFTIKCFEIYDINKDELKTLTHVVFEFCNNNARLIFRPKIKKLSPISKIYKLYIKPTTKMFDERTVIILSGMPVTLKIYGLNVINEEIPIMIESNGKLNYDLIYHVQ